MISEQLFSASREFDDSDTLAAAAREWDLDFTQLERGSYRSKLGFLASSRVLLTECFLNRRTEQRGAAPAGKTTFAIPMHDQMDLRWRGRQEAGTSLMLFRAGDELDSISEAGFHVITVSLRDDLLAENLDARGERFPRGRIAFSYPPELRNRLRRLAAQVMEHATANPGQSQSRNFLQSLEGDLVDSILDALATGRERLEPPVAKTRSQALRRAIDVIRDRCSEPVSISEVERLCGASARTLRYAFQENFGMSAKQYLQALRLNGVRRRLLGRESGAPSVSDVANEFGFWHLGQFAADYQRMFGELPSQTVARR